MHNLYLTTTFANDQYHINSENVKNISPHVPTTDQPIITIPEREIKPLIKNTTQYLNQTNNNRPLHLGIRFINDHHTVILMSYVRQNPEFTDFHLKNVDNLSKRTTDQPQVDQFIIITRETLTLLKQKLQQLTK